MLSVVEAAGVMSAQEMGVCPSDAGAPSCAAAARWMFKNVPAARPPADGCELMTVVSIAPTLLALASGNGTRTSPCAAQLPWWMYIALLLPGVKPAICSSALTYLVWGSQL